MTLAEGSEARGIVTGHYKVAINVLNQSYCDIKVNVVLKLM